MSVVLVTGGTGSIGRFVVGELHRRGHDCVVVSRRPPPEPVDTARYCLADINDDAQVGNVIEQHRVTRVIHLAAIVSGAAEADPAAAIATNCAGTNALLASSVAAKVERVVLMSTKAVLGTIGGAFGPPNYQPISETSIAPHPTSVYGLTKLCAEHLGEFYSKAHGLPVVSVRGSTTVGPGGGRHAPVTIIENAARGERAVVEGGDAVDDFLWYGDLAQALVLAATTTNDLQATYHIGSGVGSTLQDLADAVRHVIPDADIDIGPTRSAWAHLNCVMDIAAAKRDLGYQPIALTEVARAYIEIVRSRTHRP